MPTLFAVLGPMPIAIKRVITSFGVVADAAAMCSRVLPSSSTAESAHPPCSSANLCGGHAASEQRHALCVPMHECMTHLSRYEIAPRGKPLERRDLASKSREVSCVGLTFFTSCGIRGEG